MKKYRIKKEYVNLWLLGGWGDENTIIDEDGVTRLHRELNTPDRVERFGAVNLYNSLKEVIE